MTGELPQAKTIFWQALEVESGPTREAFLAKACGANLKLRERVERLLAAQSRSDSFIDPPGFNLTGDPDDILEGPGNHIGPYRLLEIIGEGGMGVVFMAEQTKPIKRRVALKIIKPGMDTKQVVARFEVERQALALMDHPNIARVFDGGATPSGRPYFAMELVRGNSITEYCDLQQLDSWSRLALFIDLCQAVQHAHLKGIVHRDLKPANVIVSVLDGSPVVKVIDFGVAKAIDRELTERTLFTCFDQFIGTPLYMSPEQAGLDDLDVDLRADIYSLGVLLYELLTGTTPFDEGVLRRAGFDEMRRIIREDDPPSPSVRLSTLLAAGESTVSQRRGTDTKNLGRMLRRDLDWIVMKAIDKQRSRRYESAASFARDITRFLNDEPVDAGPPSSAYRLRKYFRKHRVACLIVAGFIIALSAGIGQAFRNVRILTERNAARSALEREQRQFYFNRILLAERERLANNAAGTRRLLEECPLHLRGWEWDYLKRVVNQELYTLDNQAPLSVVAFSPDGRWLACGGYDSDIRIWDVKSREPIQTLDEHAYLITGLAFSPDGSTLVSSSSEYPSDSRGTIFSWDVATGRRLSSVEGVDHGVVCLALSPDGKHLGFVSTGPERPVKVTIWDLAANQLTRTFDWPSGRVFGLAFSPDGKQLAACGPTVDSNSIAALRVWTLGTGDLILDKVVRTEALFTVDFSPDGQSVATSGTDQMIHVWSLATGEERSRFAGHSYTVNNLSFVADDLIASASVDCTVRLWTPHYEHTSTVLRGHSDVVTAVDVDRRRNLIASASEDGTVRIWDTSADDAFTLSEQGSEVGGVAFNTDGTLIASNSRAGRLSIWEADSGLIVFHSSKHAFNFGPHNLAFSPDGHFIAVSRKDTVLLLEAATGKEVMILQDRHAGNITAIDYRHDGVQLASISLGPKLNQRGEIRICEAETGKLIRTIAAHPNLYKKIGCIKFSADGSKLVSTGGDNTARIWDASTGRQLAVLEANAAPVLGISISPDDRIVATTSDDNAIRFWDMQSGQLTRTLQGHVQDVISIAFSPDGSRLISGSNDHTVKLWDVPSGDEIITLRGAKGPIRGVSFSLDGQRVAAGSADSQVRIWETARSTPEMRASRRAARLVNRWTTQSTSPRDLIVAINDDDSLDRLERHYALVHAARYQEATDNRSMPGDRPNTTKGEAP